MLSAQFTYSIIIFFKKDMKSLFFLLMFAAVLLQIGCEPLMIEEKQDFNQKIKTKSIAIVFYGQSNSQQFHIFAQAIPTTNHLYSGIQFLHVPSSKFKLNRPTPSISIYRKIGSGDWSLYKGIFNKQQIDNWIKKQIFQQLPEINIQQLDRIFKENNKAFIVLDFGEFQFIRSKIYVQQFCQYKGLPCFKLSANNPLLNVGLRIFGLGKQDRGNSKLALYNPNTQRLQLYSKDVWFIRRQQIMEMYEGQTGIVVAEQMDNTAGDLEIELHYDEEA